MGHRNHFFQKKCSGFTLLEVLVALFIFAIISTIMASALHNLLSSQASIEKRTTRFAQLQMAMTLMSRDIEQIIDRPITTQNNSLENAVVGSDTQITFTHAGLINPSAQLLRSTLQRTNYHLENHTLVRVTWPQLDQTSQTLSNQRSLLNEVDRLQIEYLDDKGYLQHRWPPGDQASNDELPRAIRVTLTLKDLGKISQTYLVPGQKIEKPS